MHHLSYTESTIIPGIIPKKTRTEHNSLFPVLIATDELAHNQNEIYYYAPDPFKYASGNIPKIREVLARVVVSVLEENT